MFETETESLNRVIESLKTTFPLVREHEIRQIVAGIHQRFEDATVRTYIPVLVHRQARVAIMRAEMRRGVTGDLVGA